MNITTHILIILISTSIYMCIYIWRDTYACRMYRGNACKIKKKGNIQSI